MTELEAQLRAVREHGDRLERRLERLETSGALVGRRAVAREPPAPAAPAPAPALEVVKLRPRATLDAPEVPTKVTVAEPSPEVLETLEPTDEEAEPSLGDKIFDEGLAALNTGNVNGGVQRLVAFAAESPRHPRADNALYFSGVGMMSLGAFDDAAHVLEALLSKYPASDVASEGLLKLAECRVKLKEVERARRAYQRVLAAYPGTAAASAARERLITLDSPPRAVGEN